MSKQITMSGLTDSLKEIGSVLKRRFSIIFVVVALIALVYAVYSVNSLLGSSSDDSYRSTQEAQGFSTHFDQQTIKAINDLSNRQSTGSTQLPSGRINPFAE